jgi:hypothetical protein
MGWRGFWQETRLLEEPSSCNLGIIGHSCVVFLLFCLTKFVCRFIVNPVAEVRVEDRGAAIKKVLLGLKVLLTLLL